MSKISRIRFMNLNYNHNTIRVDDEIFDLNGENTLISLRNGGGKSVLVQMIVSLFVDDAHRGFDDRPFKSYFTTNKPTVVMTEWKLDNDAGYFLVGMIVRKYQGEESDKRDLEMYTFTGSYRTECAYDLDHLALIRQEENRKMLKGFSECRKLFEELKKEQTGDFDYYDISSSHARTKYYKLLGRYQINHKEWESIIWKVNQKESGLSELFQKAKDERSLVENWFMKPVEDKLGKNKIAEFRKLSFHFIEQYRRNQSGLKRKAVIEQYFEDTKPLKEEIDAYIQLHDDREEVRNELILYVQRLGNSIQRLADIIGKKQEELAAVEEELGRIVYEQISYRIYQFEDEKCDVVKDRLEAEAEITRLECQRKKLFRQITVYDCCKIYDEIKELEKEKAELEERMSVLVKQSEDNRKEIEGLGSFLHEYYDSEICKTTQLQKQNAGTLAQTEKSYTDINAQIENNNRQIREKINQIGSLESSVKSYDRIEKTYNERYNCDLSRNIVGFYEEGLLVVLQKEQDAQLRDEQSALVRYTKKKAELVKNHKRLEEEAEKNSSNLADIAHQIKQMEDELWDVRQQREKRLTIMRYVEADQEHIDHKDEIVAAIDGRIRELDADRTDIIKQQSEYEKMYHRLKDGRTMELPDNIRDYFAQNGMEVIYGMEWLSKNGRSQKDNLQLTHKNPFLPYAIIMERKEFDIFRKTEELLYTSFPIPIILRDELEQEMGHTEGTVTTFGNMHFFIMFNHHLLDKEELKRMLEELSEKIQHMSKKLEVKENELATYRTYREIIANQTYSQEYLECLQGSLDETVQKHKQLTDRQLTIRHEKENNVREQDEMQHEADKCNARIMKYENRKEAFAELCDNYGQYETDMASLSRIRKERDELEKEQCTLDTTAGELKNEIEGLTNLHRQYSDILTHLQNKAAAYEMYQDAVRGEWSEPVNRLEARFLALTKDVADTMEELQERLNRQNKRSDSKNRDLEKKRQKTGEKISKEEYRNLLFSETIYDNLEKCCQQTEIAWNAAVEQNNELERKIAQLDTELRHEMKNLTERTGCKEPVARESIVHTNFEERKKVAEYDAGVLKDDIRKLEQKRNGLDVLASGMSEYEGMTVEVGEEKMDKLRQHIPDTQQMDDKELRRYQGEQKRRIAKLSDEFWKKENVIERMIRTISSKEEYADDYFKKTFQNLLVQTAQPIQLSKQYEMNKTSYESQLAKLKVDLESVENEQKNLEELFLEYVRDVNASLSMIDKNSTINIRDRKLKMLKIEVPDWEMQKAHYAIRLHDYFENVIKLGLDAIEKNENLEEQLGKTITTKNIYDDIVGIDHIKIRLYKIEAERELPITWAQVSANSGGEGFLSAFVILTCLLSYMRQDENALFTTGREGKVLIMDNPFAQTHSEHLLKPLVEMAKKTNTQLICLSAIGGASVYNRFDNIYVLKLVDSNIRRGIKRIESTHIKGEPADRLVLSQFKIEQPL